MKRRNFLKLIPAVAVAPAFIGTEPVQAEVAESIEGFGLAPVKAEGAVNYDWSFTPNERTYFYVKGTSEPLITYSDVECNTPNCHPIIADSAGRYHTTYIPDGSDYDITHEPR